MTAVQLDTQTLVLQINKKQTCFPAFNFFFFFYLLSSCEVKPTPNPVACFFFFF